MLPEGAWFEGKVPEGYARAVCPSDNYIVVDVDQHGSISGFDNIPSELSEEMGATLNYYTKNDGMHFWFKYTGNKPLGNKSSGKGIDLRTDRGYVVWYPEYDIRDNLGKIKETSEKLNQWLEKLFSYV